MAHLDSESINCIQVDVNHISLQNRTWDSHRKCGGWWLANVL